MHRDGVDRMLCNPRPDACQTAQVHDWSEHGTLNSKLLDAMQQGLAFRTVPLRCLLFEERIDIRIATVGICALLVHKALGTRGGIARSPNRRQKHPPELFVAPG